MPSTDPTTPETTREAVEALAQMLPDVDGQVILAALSMTDHQREQPQWLWHDTESGHVQYGRWPKKPGTPYVRLDLPLAYLTTCAALLARAETAEAEVARLKEALEATELEVGRLRVEAVEGDSRDMAIRRVRELIAPFSALDEASFCLLAHAHWRDLRDCVNSVAIAVRAPAYPLKEPTNVE